MPNDDEEDHKKEVAVLLALFRRFLESVEEGSGEWEALEAIMAERAEWIVRQAIEAFGISVEEAVELIAKQGGLSPELTEKRKILSAAIDNLVDFSVAEEYQMAEAAMLAIEDFDGEDEGFDEAAERWDALLGIFKRYNDRYARVENLDAQYAMIMASYLAAKSSETVWMYMTMGDERVRPWHLQYEGFTAPKSSFPQWLIPPIEHQCRCFLVEDSASNVGSVMAQGEPAMPEWFDRTFKESVAMGGRIFSDEHPYFNVDERHVGRLNEIAARIKSRYL